LDHFKKKNNSKKPEIASKIIYNELNFKIILLLKIRKLEKEKSATN